MYELVLRTAHLVLLKDLAGVSYGFVWLIFDESDEKCKRKVVQKAFIWKWSGHVLCK